MFIQTTPNDRVLLQSCTVSGNSTALRCRRTLRECPALTIRNSTITGNAGGTVDPSSTAAGGLYFAPANNTMELDHTIIAGNSVKNGVAPDLRFIQGSTTVRFSLIGDNTGTTLTEAPLGSPDINGNLIGKPVSKGGQGVVDPRLASLADNGGPTLTHALLPGSPAIDAGAIVSGPTLGYDQRGTPFGRAVDGNADSIVRIDIGAYESQGVPSFAPGDYNRNGVVDAADYTKWRDTLGQKVTPYSGADGDGSGIVDSADYELWKTNFGRPFLIRPPAAGGNAASLNIGARALSGIAASSEGEVPIAGVQPLTAIRRRPTVADRPLATPALNDAALLAWLSSQENSHRALCRERSLCAEERPLARQTTKSNRCKPPLIRSPTTAARWPYDAPVAGSVNAR